MYNNLFTATHEFGHILNKKITSDALVPVEWTKESIRPWEEIQANEWAINKFKKWGIRINNNIKQLVTFDFFWLIKEVKENPELMDFLNNDQKGKEWLNKHKHLYV